MKEYTIIVFFSEEDEGWVAKIPDIKYLSAFGDTPEEAMQELLVAKKLWLEAAVANNIAVPEPKFNPNLLPIAS